MIQILKSDFFVVGKKGNYWAINFKGCAEESDDCRMDWRLYDRKGKEAESFRLGGVPFEGFKGLYVTDDNRFVQRNQVFDVSAGKWEYLPGCTGEEDAGAHKIILHDFNQQDEWVLDPDHLEAVMKRTVGNP